MAAVTTSFLLLLLLLFALHPSIIASLPIHCPMATFPGAKLRIQVLVMAPENKRYPFALPKVIPAVCLGIQEVRRRQLIPSVALFPYRVDTNCTVDEALSGFVNSTFGHTRTCGRSSSALTDVGSAINHYDARLLLGPVCTYSVSSLQLFNTYLCKSPVLTPGAMSAKFGQRLKIDQMKKLYQYITRAGVTYDAAVELLFKAMAHFNWGHFLIAFSTDYYAHPFYEYRYCNTLKSDIMNYKKQRHLPVTIEEANFNRFERPVIEEILMQRMRREIAGKRKGYNYGRESSCRGHTAENSGKPRGRV